MEKSELYFEDLNIGDEDISQGRTVTEADIVNFAGISGDFNPLHTDEEFGKKTQFGKRIAHGLLGICISSGIRRKVPPLAMIAALGMEEWRFLKPIFIGDTIYVKNTIVEKKETSKPDQGVVRSKRQLINQNNKVVQEGIILHMVKRRGDEQ